MKKILFVLLIVVISCDKNNNGNILFGAYTETAPISGRTKLKFVSGNRVIKTESGNPTEDIFYYKITGNKIELIPTRGNSSTAELEIDILNNSQFVIESLYVSIPELPKTCMTFKR